MPEATPPTPSESVPTGAYSDSHARPVRIDARLRSAAATRLIGQGAGSGQRFLDTAARLGIDVSLMWGTLDPTGKRVRQICLAVCGAGRTVMLFLSGDAPGGASPDAAAAAHAERVAVVREACRFVAQPAAEGGRGVRLAQALLEPRESVAAAALRGAGFLQLGDLEYLRLAPLESREVEPALRESWPGGVRVRRVSDLSPPEAERFLLEAMDRSYEETLDCPELCGLREVADVLESHRAVGVFDPSLWWVATLDDRAAACMLFSRCPEQDTIELVYLGISPGFRGKGLGAALLHHGLSVLRQRNLTPPGGLTCAVDTRNAPALRLYRTMGFDSFATRQPFVLGLSHAAQN